ncbi:hypothetical protein [Facklamia hominis]|uniref:hypothetical protein n=1 Tax=Facklamia hominis TaxID=178214 RepID=UPI0038FBE949
MYIVTIFVLNDRGRPVELKRYSVSKDSPDVRKKIVDEFRRKIKVSIFDESYFIDGDVDFFEWFQNDLSGFHCYRAVIEECDLNHWIDLKRRGKLSDKSWRDW